MDELIKYLCRQQHEWGGIDTARLPVGTILRVQTRNHLYCMEKLDGDTMRVHGGEFFPEPTVVRFSGSTFGGTSIKIGWIGRGMHMEIYDLTTKQVVVTTGVREATVVGQGFEFVMWETKEHPEGISETGAG